MLLRTLAKVIPVYLALACLAPPASAEWSTITHKEGNGDAETTVAYIINKDGYSLELYIDGVRAVRGRFSLPAGLLTFPGRFCPTYRIDNGNPNNRSMNDAPCISTSQWVEYILGQEDHHRIASTPLLALMRGNTISFMFMLSNHDFRQTSFSLRGSRRAIMTAFGKNTIILKSR